MPIYNIPVGINIYIYILYVCVLLSRVLLLPLRSSNNHDLFLVLDFTVPLPQRLELIAFAVQLVRQVARHANHATSLSLSFGVVAWIWALDGFGLLICGMFALGCPLWGRFISLL